MNSEHYRPPIFKVYIIGEPSGSPFFFGLDKRVKVWYNSIMKMEKYHVAYCEVNRIKFPDKDPLKVRKSDLTHFMEVEGHDENDVISLFKIRLSLKYPEFKQLTEYELMRKDFMDLTHGTTDIAELNNKGIREDLQFITKLRMNSNDMKGFQKYKTYVSEDIEIGERKFCAILIFYRKKA